MKRFPDLERFPGLRRFPGMIGFPGLKSSHVLYSYLEYIPQFLYLVYSGMHCSLGYLILLKVMESRDGFWCY